MKTLLSRLGLTESASEADAVLALTNITAERDRLIALSGKTTFADALGVLTALSQLPAQVEALKTELANSKLTGEREQLLTKAKADGRLTPVAETFARSQTAWPIATLSAYLKTLPVIKGAGLEPEDKPADGEVKLTADELHEAKRHGLDPAKMLETKKLTLARAGK